MTHHELLALGLDQADIDRAHALQRDSLVIDCSEVIEYSPGHFDRATHSGVTVVNHTVTRPLVGTHDALMQMAEARRFLAAHPDRVSLCLSTDDIRAAHENGTETVIFGPQDSLFLGNDLDLLDTFYELGMRIMQLTYQYRNWVGDGCGEPDGRGLTRFGRDLVREMGERGIVVDLSHCGPGTTKDAIEISDKPVLFTHAHPNAVTPSIRAKSDDLLRALASKGGVVGVTTLSSFNVAVPGVRPGLKEWLNHIEYLVDLIGPDHVGIGSDFDETLTEESDAEERATYPELFADYPWTLAEDNVKGIANLNEFINAAPALASLGYDDATIRKILGGNFLRVLEQVWVPGSR